MSIYKREELIPPCSCLLEQTAVFCLGYPRAIIKIAGAYSGNMFTISISVN